METKPKAQINFEGWHINIDGTFRTAKTEAEAKAIAEEWEAQKVKEWEIRTSKKTRLRKAQEYLWNSLFYLVEELKTEARSKGRHGYKEEVEGIVFARKKIENLLTSAKEEYELEVQ